jgi:hypothetical protein
MKALVVGAQVCSYHKKRGVVQLVDYYWFVA